MKMPPFTLVQSLASAKRRAASAKDVPSLAHISKNLRSTILSTLGDTEEQSGMLTLLTEDLSRSKDVITVGVWDLGVWVGGLLDIISAMNRATDGLTIFQVQAAIPAGIIWQKERVRAWAERKLKRKLNRTELRELTAAIVDDEFLPLVEKVRGNVGVDYLIALTPARIAGELDDEEGRPTVPSDLYSSPGDKVSLVSTYQLRELSAETSRPYEYAVAIVVLSALLVLMNSKLEFHDETRGCLFDLNYNRHDIVSSLRKPHVDESCLRKIKEKYRGIALDLLKAVAAYPDAKELEK